MKSYLPNFLITGVMKGSTSSALQNLNKHLDVYCLTSWRKRNINEKLGINTDDFVGGLGNPDSKEVDFFNRTHNYDFGLEFYKQYFPKYRIAMGEASANYFYNNEPNQEGTVERMSSSIPNAKIITILRDPITRAFSHWNHAQNPDVNFGSKFRDKTFHECTVENPFDKWNGILRRSLYLENLTSYINAFGAENIHVTTQEAIKADNVTEYNKMFTFLGVDTLESDPGYSVANVGTYNTTIEDSTLTWLKGYYKSDVDSIKALYPNLDYSLWNTY